MVGQKEDEEFAGSVVVFGIGDGKENPCPETEDAG